jgi:hemoglobin
MAETKKQTLFEALGGLPTLQRVHKIFYDKVYAHPWLGKFFAGHSQEAIKARQTSFMAEKMGSDKPYYGKDMKMAHRQMYITPELFELRHDLLRESIREAGVPEELAQRWLKIDSAFYRQIVKDSIESFYAWSWKYETRVIVPRPRQPLAG